MKPAEKKKQPEQASANVNDIIKKMADLHDQADKKLEELSSFCLGKDCRAKKEAHG